MWISGRLYNSSPALCRMSNCTDGELVSHWFRPAAIQGLLSWKNWSTSIWSRRLEFCFIHAIHVLMYSFDVWLFGWMWTNHGLYVSKHTTSESRKFLSWMVEIYIYIHVFHFERLRAISRFALRSMRKTTASLRFCRSTASRRSPGELGHWPIGDLYHRSQYGGLSS